MIVSLIRVHYTLLTSHEVVRNLDESMLFFGTCLLGPPVQTEARVWFLIALVFAVLWLSFSLVLQLGFSILAICKPLLGLCHRVESSKHIRIQGAVYCCPCFISCWMCSHDTKSFRSLSAFFVSTRDIISFVIVRATTIPLKTSPISPGFSLNFSIDPSPAFHLSRAANPYKTNHQVHFRHSTHRTV